MQIWESVGKCQNYSILNKMKDSLGQECLKGKFLSFQGKIGKLPLISLKNDSFSNFDPLSYLSLPKIWLSHPQKLYF